MQQGLQPGDFLIFQLEAGFALLRLIAIDEVDGEKVWHIRIFGDFFLDVETAETALNDPSKFSISADHLALTNRAFESTQVAKIGNMPLTPAETTALDIWRRNPDRKVSDRSVRLLMGIR